MSRTGTSTQRVRDIIIGPGRVYRNATVQAALPDENLQFGNDWANPVNPPSGVMGVAGWERVGLLMRGSGVMMRHSVTMHEVMAEEYIMGLARVPTQRAIAFAFTVLQYNIANLQLVFPDSDLTTTAPGADQVGFDDLILGAGQDNKPYCIGVEAFRKDAAGNMQPVRWRIYEASVEPDGETPFAQGAESIIPIVCHALHHDASGKVAQLQYVTAPGT